MPKMFQEIPGGGDQELHCLVCMYALTRLQIDDGWNLFHPRAMLKDGRWQEHDPEPAVTTTATQIRPVCDFCSRPHPRWAYQYAPSETLTVYEKDGDTEDTFHVTMQSDEQWAACVACSNLIDMDMWLSLIDRVVKENADFGPRVQEDLRAHCKVVYDMLRAQGKVAKRLLSVVP